MHRVSTLISSPLAAAGICCALAGGFAASQALAQVPPAGCSVSAADGSVVDCTGNHSSGIALNNAAGPFRVLNVFALSSNIAPLAGTTGIVFTSNEDVALSVTTGSRSIVTDSAPAIAAMAVAAGNLAASINADILTSATSSAGVMLATDAGALAADVFGTIRTSGNNVAGIMAGSNTGAVGLFVGAAISTSGQQSIGIYAGSSSDVAIAAARRHRDLRLPVAGHSGRLDGRFSSRSIDGKYPHFRRRRGGHPGRSSRFQHRSDGWQHRYQRIRG